MLNKKRKRINGFGATYKSSLTTFLVKVFFSENSLDDLISYPKEKQKRILALIMQRGKKGLLIKPDGLGGPLGGELGGFTKIKPKAMSLRIIYRL